MRNIALVAGLFFLALAGSVALNVSTGYSADVMDCQAMDLDSCDFSGLDTLCQQLFSNPRPCDKLCKDSFSGDVVGTCVICCKNIRSQLGLGQPKEVELED